ncbi:MULTISPECIES: hypothetical protein [unclassified Microcoleus]|uniref:hypothetical protein n=1 Tax=unclassified Microcoleus TaxID=2642155 RepID=UPI002FD730B6
MSAEQTNPMRFKGVASDGLFKGKVIEGKLDIKVNVESVTDQPKEEPKPAPFGWETILFAVFFLLVLNQAAGDPGGMRKYQIPQRSSHHQILPQ